MQVPQTFRSARASQRHSLSMLVTYASSLHSWQASNQTHYHVMQQVSRGLPHPSSVWSVGGETTHSGLWLCSRTMVSMVQLTW